MRLAALFGTAAAALIAVTAPASAGLFELPFDRITLSRDCQIEPCRDNNLTYKRIWFKDRYLRYDIHVTPPRYVMRRVRVMVEPPLVSVADPADRNWFDFGGDLVELPAGKTRVVGPAQYEWVREPVLVAPARNTVTRRHPYFAYYPDRITVDER